MAKPKGKTANIFVWIILGLLVIGLAGFGVDGFGGSVRSVGKVGDREIRVQDYARALQQEIRSLEQQFGQAISLQQAQAMGLDRAVLAQLVSVAALENEAMRVGISAGDATVREEILSIPAFRGLDGNFSREAYRFTLQQEGWSERDFEDRVRLDVARSILQAGVVSATTAPQAFVDALHGWQGEGRDISVLRIERAQLPEPVPAPTDADLAAFYADNPEAFTLPEARRITYVWVTPAMIVDDIVVDEQALRELYDFRIADFAQPERRLVERLVFADAADADAARARLDAGEIDFPGLVAERGLALEDTDMGDVTEAQLGAAGPGVFALDGPGIAGPLPSPFGPALFRVNAILAAQEIPFEQAIPELREQLAIDRARRLIADRFDEFEDLLAGGAELEDLARDTEMELGTIDFREGSREGIAGYEAFRRAAETVREGAFPQIEALEDGGVFALRLDAVVPPELQPFEAVVVQVIEAWDAAEAAARIAAHAATVAAALDAGETAEGLGLVEDALEGITRDAFVPGVPRAVVAAAFTLEPGARETVQANGVAYLLTLERIVPAETGTPEAEAQRRAIADRAREGVAQDLFSSYARLLEREAGITINDAAIQAVHAQFR